MKTTHPRHPRAHTLPSRGFTLLEMVIVLGIIAILLGSAISLLKGLPRVAENQRVESDFRAISSALQAYKVSAGTYPTNAQGLQALVSAPEHASRWVKIMDKLPTDPWGSAYTYKFPGTKKAGEFEVISIGPDQEPGTSDDLSSQDK